MYIKILISLLLLSITQVTTAATATPRPSVEQLSAQLAKLSSDPIKIEEVNETPIPGLYEISVGSTVFYMTHDAKFILYGHVLDLSGDKPVSLTENTIKKQRVKLIKAVDESSMVVFAPTTPTKHTITVFTDIDCPFCRKLHKEVPELNKAGVKVRYLAFPRTGVGSPSYLKALAVWCAKDPEQAMTDAKTGTKVPPAAKDCHKDQVIRNHLDLVRSLDLRFTPAIILEDGTMVSGYLPSEDLLKRLNNDGGASS